MQKINKTFLMLAALSLTCCGSAFAADAPAAGSAAAAPAAAAPAPAAPAAAAEKPAAKGTASKVQFTSAVNNHEPTDDLKSMDNSHTRIFCYAVLSNLQDQEVTFRWTYNGVSQGEWKTTPKSARWRTASSKELDPSKLGTWTVDIVDSSGNNLASKTFDYTKGEAAAPAAPSAAPAAATK